MSTYEVHFSDANRSWHSAESVREEWSPNISDQQLENLLEIALDVVRAYAPAFDEEGPIPQRLRLAQLLYAKDTLNASRVQPGGQMDENSFALTPFPLSWKIKGLIRPQRGVPAVG